MTEDTTNSTITRDELINQYSGKTNWVVKKDDQGNIIGLEEKDKYLKFESSKGTNTQMEDYTKQAYSFNPQGQVTKYIKNTVIDYATNNGNLRGEIKNKVTREYKDGQPFVETTLMYDGTKVQDKTVKRFDYQAGTVEERYTDYNARRDASAKNEELRKQAQSEQAKQEAKNDWVEIEPGVWRLQQQDAQGRTYTRVKKQESKPTEKTVIQPKRITTQDVVKENVPMYGANISLSPEAISKQRQQSIREDKPISGIVIDQEMQKQRELRILKSSSFVGTLQRAPEAQTLIEKLKGVGEKSEYARKFKNPTRTKEATATAIAFTTGIASGGLKLVQHPVQSVKGMIYSLRHPIKSTEELSKSFYLRPVFTSGELTGQYLVTKGASKIIGKGAGLISKRIETPLVKGGGAGVQESVVSYSLEDIGSRVISKSKSRYEVGSGILKKEFLIETKAETISKPIGESKVSVIATRSTSEIVKGGKGKITQSGIGISKITGIGESKGLIASLSKQGLETKPSLVGYRTVQYSNTPDMLPIEKSLFGSLNKKGELLNVGIQETRVMSEATLGNIVKGVGIEKFKVGGGTEFIKNVNKAFEDVDYNIGGTIYEQVLRNAKVSSRAFSQEVEQSIVRQAYADKFSKVNLVPTTLKKNKILTPHISNKNNNIIQTKKIDSLSYPTTSKFIITQNIEFTYPKSIIPINKIDIIKSIKSPTKNIYTESGIKRTQIINTSKLNILSLDNLNTNSLKIDNKNIRDVIEERISDKAKSQIKQQTKETKSLTRLLTKNISQNYSPIIPKPFIFPQPSFKLPNFSYIFKTNLGKRYSTFNVEVRRGGKFYTIGRNLSYNQAVNLGSKKVLTTLAATFKISKAGFRYSDKKLPEVKLQSLKPFRQYESKNKKKKKDELLFIQKTSKEGGPKGGRLSNPLEVLEIQKSKKNNNKGVLL